jgi:hypothetical protein
MPSIRSALAKIIDRWPAYIPAVGLIFSAVWLAVLVWFGVRLYDFL